MKNRIIYSQISARMNHRHGRLMLVTGARQTGKTTLCRQFDGYDYISLEDPVLRPYFRALSAAEWSIQYPRAVVDEVQKVPQIIETIKAAYDEYEQVQYLLTGSAQILLLNQVKESLAGRISLFELFPLILPEMLTNGWEDPILESRLQKWIRLCHDNQMEDDFLKGLPQQSERYIHAKSSFLHYLAFGGMPETFAEDLNESDIIEWLHNYIQTYLQRDIRDLSRMRELEPFVLAQKWLAQNTAQVINVSNLARSAGIAVSTAKRFLQYLDLSYQTIKLMAWHRNPNKRLVKMPKIHFLDPGICRAILGRTGELTGHEWESAVVAEIVKQLRYLKIPLGFYHLRTFDGKEIDLVVEMGSGYLLIECKQGTRVTVADFRHFRGVDQILDKPILGCWVLSMDEEIKQFGADRWAFPAPWLFS